VTPWAMKRRTKGMARTQIAPMRSSRKCFMRRCPGVM
jgi:hypothetical protein